MTPYKTPDWRTFEQKQRDAFLSAANFMASISCPTVQREVTINGKTLIYTSPAVYGIRIS